VRLAQMVSLIATLRRRRYDLLHLHSVSLGFVGMAAGAPYAIHAHGSDLHQNFKYPLLKIAGRLALRGADRILYVTPNLGSFLDGYDLVIGQMRQGILSLCELEVLAVGRPLLTCLNPALYADDPPPVRRIGERENLAEAIESLRADPAEVHRLSAAGPQWIRRQHSPATTVRVLGSVY